MSITAITVKVSIATGGNRAQRLVQKVVNKAGINDIIDVIYGIVDTLQESCRIDLQPRKDCCQKGHLLVN